MDDTAKNEGQCDPPDRPCRAGGVADSPGTVPRSPAPVVRSTRRLRPFEPYRLCAQAGDQVDLEVAVGHGREYSIQTFGSRGAAMTLFEAIGERLVHYADDERSTEFNAGLRVNLCEGTRYVLRLRICFGQASREEAVMMW